MDVFLVNESSLSDLDAWNIAWALDHQARFQYGRVGWRTDIRVIFAPGGGHARIPAGGWILHLLKTCDVAGALGYHDEDGHEVPFARVGVQTAIDDGQHPSEVASHELLEMATDPHVNDSCIDPQANRLYAKEVGDACQGNGYDVGRPEGRTTGIVVADFVLPGYFDPGTPSTTTTDFRSQLHGPFALGPQGYYSYIDLNDVSAGWQQQIGAERTSAPTPDRDDRLGRRA